MVQQTQNLDLVLKDVGVFDEPLVDYLDTPFRVRRLLECSLVNGAISSASDGLNDSKRTLWWNL